MLDLSRCPFATLYLDVRLFLTAPSSFTSSSNDFRVVGAKASLISVHYVWQVEHLDRVDVTVICARKQERASLQFPHFAGFPLCLSWIYCK